jgi:rubrerythrin
MSRSKSRDAEDYRGIIRNQKKIIQHLKRELSRKEKRAHQYEDLEEREAEEFIREEIRNKEIIKKEKCPECSKNIDIVELGPRKLYLCGNCGWRKVTKGG